MAAFHQNLIERGLAARLGEATATAIEPVSQELERTVTRVRALFGQ
jgi:hypothetical protein